MPRPTSARISGTDRTDDEVGELLIGTMLERLDGAEIPIQPGAADLLAEVAASGVPFALVSASVRPIVDLVLAFLTRSGLPVFPVSVAGDEVARSKPDPLPYLHAADLLGVDITRAVVLEDSLNGVRAAWSAGATVVAVPHAVPVEAGERIVVRESLVGLDMAGWPRSSAEPGSAQRPARRGGPRGSAVDGSGADVVQRP